MKLFYDNILCKEIHVETTVVAYLNNYVFRRVDVSGADNQCLMYALNAFYKDVDNRKKAIVFYGML